MRLTDIFKFKLFDRTDKADLDVVNENFQNVETALNNCMQPRNIFTGDIDTLRSTGKAGVYWVHPVSKGTTSGTNSFPFADGENYYDLYVFVKNASDSTQMAIRFDADGKHDVRYRMYANGKWYPWSTALGKADISNIGDGTITGAISELLKKLTSHKSSGDHDSRYYTETEMDSKLSGKSDTSHNHDSRYLQKSAVINNNTTTEAGYALDARQANPNVSGSLGAQISSLNKTLTTHSHAWSAITGKPSTFSPASHTHDERYYTKDDINNKISYVNSSTAGQTFNNTAHYIEWKWSDTGNLCCFVDNALVFMAEGWTSVKRS